MTVGKAALSVREFCQAYGVSRSTYYSMSPIERPASFKWGRRRLILLKDIRRWEEEMIRRNDGQGLNVPIHSNDISEAGD